MSKNFFKISKGINLNPQSTDPVNPAEGATYYSDGTVRTEGLWQYKSGAWAIVGSAGGVGSAGASTLKTADYTVVSGDNGKVIEVNTTSSAIVITLPSPSAGFIVTVKDLYGTSATNKIYVNPGAALMDNISYIDIIDVNYQCVSYISDGTNWSRFLGFVGNGILERGLFGGGSDGSPINVIDYIAIATLGNATDFGDLTRTANATSSLGNRIRGIWAGGTVGPQNVIDYVNIATIGNAVDFGDLTVARQELSATANDTRGLMAAGTSGGRTNIIDYITIATTGNAVDFGDLTGVRTGIAAASSATRAIFAGGNTPSILNTIDYVTIASAGNATSFGTLATAREYAAGCSSSTRSLIGGGDTVGSVSIPIEYLTTATTGNGTTFGDLTIGRWFLAACSSQLRGIWGGGYNLAASVAYNVMDYVTIASTGNATDFGDLSATKTGLGGCSNAHGGLL